jgi:hypothetical protein
MFSSDLADLFPRTFVHDAPKLAGVTDCRLLMPKEPSAGVDRLAHFNDGAVFAPPFWL